MSSNRLTALGRILTVSLASVKLNAFSFLVGCSAYQLSLAAVVVPCAWAQLSLSVAPGPRQRHGRPGASGGSQDEAAPRLRSGPSGAVG